MINEIINRSSSVLTSSIDQVIARQVPPQGLPPAPGICGLAETGSSLIKQQSCKALSYFILKVLMEPDPFLPAVIFQNIEVCKLSTSSPFPEVKESKTAL